jgi:N-acetylneuraminic acid mutarotase
MKNIVVCITIIILGMFTVSFAYSITDDCVPGGFAPTEKTNVANPPQPIDDPDPITWTTRTPSPALARYWCPGTGVVRDTIWFLGGRSSSIVSLNEINAYVPAADAWVTTGLPVLLTARRAGGGGRIGNKIYVAGGRDAASTTLSTCEEFDVDTKVSTAKASMPAAYWAVASAVAGGKLYIIGNDLYTGTNYEYDPATNTWATKAPCPVGRGWSAAAGVGGKVYVFGGGGAGSTYLSDCYEYDPATNAWTLKAPMPGPRIYHSTVAVNDQDIYVVGGSTSGAIASDNLVYKYNVASNSWTTETPMPTARGWLMVNQVGSAIYASYGSNCTTPTYLSTNERGSIAPPPNNDVGVDAIIYPVGTHRVNTPMVPIARVKNYGVNAQTNFPVVCSIVGAGGVFRYTNTQTISLASGRDSLVNFNSWTPTIAEVETVKMRTNLPNDTEPTNDRKTGTVLLGDWFLNEGFNNTTFPPSGWQAVILSGTYNWQRFIAGTYPTCTPYEGAGMAGYLSFSASAGGGARLISPLINVATPTSCSLKFWMMHDPGYPGDLGPDSVRIETSTNGTTFTQVASFRRYEAVQAWTEHTVFLGTFTGNFYVAFEAYSQYGNNMYIDLVRVVGSSGIEEGSNTRIQTTALNSVRPNPVKGIAHISFNISEPTRANLRIYDASGRLVKTLVNSKLENGVYNLFWNGTDDNNRAVSEGIYFYTLETNNNNSTKKLVLTR